MAKSLFIAEKPSVAKEFAKALKENMKSCDGYMESNNIIVTPKIFLLFINMTGIILKVL